MQNIHTHNINRSLILIIFLLLHISVDAQSKSTDNSLISLQLLYETQDLNNKTITKSVTVYNNSVLNSDFQIPYRFSCSDLGLFTMEQFAVQYYNRTPFTLLITNYTQQVGVTFNTYYTSPAPNPAYYSCPLTSTNKCSITVTMGCTTTDGYNILTVGLSVGGQSLLQFQFNYICYLEDFKQYQPPQWGALIIAVFSIFMIFVCSKFQQAQSVDNLALYINYPFIIIVNILSVVRFVLVGLRIPYIQFIIYYICLGGAILLGVPAFILCFTEGAYALNLKALLRSCKCGLKFRPIHFIGFLFGLGAFCGWYFSDTNWIISDIIFIVIYVGVIKIIKFGSLKIALASFACALILGIVFVSLATKTSVYVNVDYFNNPLFLTAPILAPVPNQRCSWYFLIAMAYPGMFLAYLERFDKNRSSLIYSPTFLICYGVFSIVWFVVGSLIKAPLPYDLFTVPISMVLLLLFANRRGELEDLWEGRFFDEQKSFYQNQKQMKATLKVQKSASNITYEKELFDNLKYRQSANSSKFSEIIKGVREERESTELRHIYSQGQEKGRQQNLLERDPLSNETENVSKNLVSENESGRWTLSKYS